MILSLFAYYLIGLPMYLLFGWFVYRRYHARQQCFKGYICVGSPVLTAWGV